LVEKSVFEGLREANILARNFLRSDHNPYRRGRQIFKEVEKISEEQQSQEVTEVASNGKGFNRGSNEIPELEFGKRYLIDSEGVKIDKNGDKVDGDNQQEEYKSGGGLLGPYNDASNPPLPLHSLVAVQLTKEEALVHQLDVEADAASHDQGRAGVVAGCLAQAAAKQPP
jgi:hypothetical protein